jgi:hypothetical protein
LEHPEIKNVPFWRLVGSMLTRFGNDRETMSVSLKNSKPAMEEAVVNVIAVMPVGPMVPYPSKSTTSDEIVTKVSGGGEGGEGAGAGVKTGVNGREINTYAPGNRLRLPAMP